MKKTGVFVIVIVIVIVSGAILAYKRVYPLILVGTNFVLARELDEHIELAARLDRSASKQAAVDQIIKNKKSEILLKKLGLKVTKDALKDEWVFYTHGKSGEYSMLINDYFSGNEELFRKYLVYPAVLEVLLQIKYNSADLYAFTRAQDVLDQIDQGGKFEELAKNYSDDKVSGQLGGDLGFFEQGEILPELEHAIIEAPLSEVSKQIVVSRYGYHIVYPVETAEKNLPTDGQAAKKLWHAKHILIKTSGFEEWQVEKTKDIRVWKIIKI